MIGLLLVDWLVELLAEHAPTLSEYSFHYSLALLMNLVLRNKGEEVEAVGVGVMV